MRSNYLAVVVLCVLALGLAKDVHAQHLTSRRPDQYPSPTVKVPAAGHQFDADYSWQDNTLTGDWRGLRSELAQQGVVFGGRYVPVLMDNHTGGFDTGFFGGGPLGITTTIDTERLAGIEGGTLFFDWEFYSWYNGRFTTNNQFDPTGSYVGVNTNLLDGDTKDLNQVAQLYYQQSMWDDAVEMSFGKMDANVPFAAVQAAGAFQNSIAMFTSTLNPFLPTYQNEATALVVSLQMSDAVVGKFGWFDGTTAAYDPGTGNSGPATGPRGPSTFFNNDGNWFLITEWDLSWQLDACRPGSAGVGAWVQTGLTDTAGADTVGVSDVPGWYTQWQQTVWSPSADVAADGGGLIYYGQFGWSDPNKNPVHWSLMTGFSATGVFPHAPADAAGIMFAYTDFTSNPSIYQSTLRNGLAGPAGGHELSLESFYIWYWTPWSYLQPGVMWIDSPGGGEPAALDDDFMTYLLIGFEL
ncbi:carbohydrate porin [Aeoliella sp.]|uniref:carbohydrate porin n=1 Tax=Aeoliella sp. TaxID=2795800 RepID=UPI003CCC115F